MGSAFMKNACSPSSQWGNLHVTAGKNAGLKGEGEITQQQ
jgi:hypothetical protein